MNYQNFLIQIQKEIAEQLPEQYSDASVSIQKVVKNNNTERMGFNIHRPGESTSPQLYLEASFEEHQQGKEIQAIAKEIVASYMQHQNFEIPNVPELISDYEKVKGLMQLQLINKEFNSEKLEHTPHKDLENTDLTAVLRIHLLTQETGTATILVSDALLSRWNKSMDEVYPLALQNTQGANPARIESLYNIMMSMMSDEPYQGADTKDFQMQPYEQYVLRNESGLNGAAILLYPEVMEQLAQGANANLFILPSSIHECILMQDTGEMSAKELQAMVMSVNQTEVAPEECLSNEVYYYDKNEHSLSMATNREETAELKAHFSQIGDFEREQALDMEREA